MSTVYTVNGKVLKNAANDKWLTKKEAPDYNPLGLDPGVFRIKVTPGTSSWAGAQTATLVDGTTDVYDVQFTTSNLTAWNKSMALEVLGANTTGWTGLGEMFVGCSNLTSVALFDTSRFTSMSYMFQTCNSLSSVPLFDTSSVTNMSYMFTGCSALTTVPLFDTSSVTNMYDMFYNCTNLTSVPLFDTSSVTNMNSMLSNCIYLTSVPLFDTSSVTNMRSMLYGCFSLTSVPLFDTSNVTDMTVAFYGCNNVQSGALALYQQASSQTNPPTDYEDCFRYCGRDTTTGAAELAQIPSSWGGTGA